MVLVKACFKVDGKKAIMVTSRLDQAKQRESMRGPSKPSKLGVVIQPDYDMRSR
jgi:hypothetical protein